MLIHKFSNIKYKNTLQNLTHVNLLKKFDGSVSDKLKSSHSLRSHWLESKDFNKDEMCDIISYIVVINSSKSNIMASIISIKGKVLVHLTSGKVGLKGASKTKKFAMITILKKIIYSYPLLKNKPVAIKLKGLKYNNKLILKKFSENFLLKAIIYENSIPHNGCRPRKIRRK